MIKTPKELLDFMSDFEYKWMDKDGNFHEDITPEMYDFYSLMSPEEVKKYNPGDILPIFIIFDGENEVLRLTGEFSYDEFISKLKEVGVMLEENN